MTNSIYPSVWGRKGKLTCTPEFLSDCYEQNLNIFEKCIITKADHNYLTNTFEYYFVCNQLEMVGEGCLIPEYVCHVTRSSPASSLTYKFTKKE